jgi:hypothetical protein
VKAALKCTARVVWLEGGSAEGAFCLGGVVGQSANEIVSRLGEFVRVSHSLLTGDKTFVSYCTGGTKGGGMDSTFGFVRLEEECCREW